MNPDNPRSPGPRGGERRERGDALSRTTTPETGSAGGKKAPSPVRSGAGKGGAGSGKKGAVVPIQPLVIHRGWRRTLIGLLVLVFGVVVYRLTVLQLIEGPSLAERAQATRTRSATLLAQRGDILDSSGNPLATSVERVNLVIDQTLIKEFVHRDPETREILGTGALEAAKLMAPILQMDRLELGGQLVGEARWKLIARELLPSTYNEIAQYRIKGVFPERSYKRIYPNGALAGSVIGFTGIPSPDAEQVPVGVMGLESFFDEALTGVDGERLYEVGYSNKIIPSTEQIVTPAQPGQIVHTSLNRDIQHVAEEALNASVEKHNAKWGAAVVVEVGTGRVLALADSGWLDPNEPGRTSPENYTSHAASTPTEPGSSGKLPTFAAALDQGTVTPTSVFPVSYTWRAPNGQVIKDSLPHPDARMTVAGILAKSYNTGLVQIGDTVPDATRYDYLQRFGIGRPSGIELPNESPGILRSYERWGPRDRYTNMFGQGFVLTAVQLAGMVHTIANDGVYIAPHLTDGISETKDGPVTPIAVPHTERVISSETAADMIAIMEESNLGGTSHTAAVENYRVAGKTGTAQTADEEGPLHGRVGTFVGIIPAEAPRIAVSVMLYLPDGTGYGTVVAAPVFAEIAEFSMRELGVAHSTEEHRPIAWYEEDL